MDRPSPTSIRYSYSNSSLTDSVGISRTLERSSIVFNIKGITIVVEHCQQDLVCSTMQTMVPTRILIP